MGKATGVLTYSKTEYMPLDQSRKRRAWNSHEIALLQQAANQYGGHTNIPAARLEALAAETRRNVKAVKAKLWKLASGYQQPANTAAPGAARLKRRRTRYKRSEIKKVTALYESGAGAAQIAEQIDRSEASVRVVLRDLFGTSRRAPIQINATTDALSETAQNTRTLIERFWCWYHRRAA